jgi:hypothetical protein
MGYNVKIPMTPPIQITLLVVGAVAFAWLMISVSGSWPIFLAAKMTLEPLGEQQTRECLAIAMSPDIVDPQWAAEEAFEPTGAYTVTHMAGLARAVAWTKVDESTYLMVYLIGSAGISMEFVTVCGENVLETSSKKDAQLFPWPPGSYQQSFSTSTSELWRRHQEAIQYLSQVSDFRPSNSPPDLGVEFARGLKQQAHYVRSLPFWPLRVSYWYFVRRNFRHNKTVRQLMEAGR